MGVRPMGRGKSAMSAGCTPHFLFPLVEKKTGRARSKRKDRLDALRRIRASALYGGRREMVPACLRGPADRRGGVRYRLDGGFPRRGCVLGWGAKPHLTSSSFRAFRFATRCLGGCGGLCWRADEGVRPYTELEAFVTLARADTQVGPYKMHKADGISVGADAFKKQFHATTTPTPSAPSATGRQYRPHRRPKRARRPGKIGAGTGTPTPVRAEGHCTGARPSAFFSYTGRGAFSFWRNQKENGGRIPAGPAPCGSRIPRGRRCGGPYRSRQTSSSSDRS